MAGPEKVTGMVLSAMSVGEYDRRIVLLTTDRGKISGFARGAKKSGSGLTAAAQPFVFGEFMVYQGKSSYTFVSAKVSDYFAPLREDMEALCYGSYFLEMADYYGRENEDDRQMLALLYLAVKAVIRKAVPLRLVRCIYELKIMTLQGEYPQFFGCADCGRADDLTYFSLNRRGMLCSEHGSSTSGAIAIGKTALHAAQYIVTSPVEKLFGFSIPEGAIGELEALVSRWRRFIIDKEFKSLAMLELL